jgi:dihydroorotase
MMNRPTWFVGSLLLAIGCAQPLPASQPVEAPAHDLVLAGGRVMDPESGVDRTLNVGIRDGRIVSLSSDPLKGREIVDVTGMVVAPGFIDLHAHGQSELNDELQARDGVTTHLEMEIGVFPVRPWYAAREGRRRIHFGATAGHSPARLFLLEGKEVDRGHGGIAGQLGDSAGKRAATPEEIRRLGELLGQGLDEGALGIGFLIRYTPGATPDEIRRMFRVAAAHHVPVFAHIRKNEPEGLAEVIRDAETTATLLHVAHIGSSAPRWGPEALAMIQDARNRGVDVTTEVYPYGAGSTNLASVIFDDGWQQRMKIDYGDIQWLATGERLTAETFAKYRRQGGGPVIHHSIPEATVQHAVAAPGVIIASDAGEYDENGNGHPRSAGTFARVLGHYVREKKALSLMEALAKMTILPARRLEAASPAMRTKGRIKVGADADVTVFDPARVIDRATYEHAALPSDGISYVVVNGTLVVRDGKLVPAVFPGRGIRAEPR